MSAIKTIAFAALVAGGLMVGQSQSADAGIFFGFGRGGGFYGPSYGYGSLNRGYGYSGYGRGYGYGYGSPAYGYGGIRGRRFGYDDDDGFRRGRLRRRR